MRVARFQVATELLADLLHLPSGASIVGASMEWRDRTLTLVVDDPLLPEADEPHDVAPSATRERIVWSWNLPAESAAGLRGNEQP